MSDKDTGQEFLEILLIPIIIILILVFPIIIMNSIQICGG